MLAGPIFSRTALTIPRRIQTYLLRAGYAFVMFVLIYTASQVTFGWQQYRSADGMARFGALLFSMLALVQMLLVTFASLLFAAGSIASEKERRTLILLLMTDLKNQELIGGKLLASLLSTGTIILVGIPIFVFLQHLGGFTIEQVFWSTLLATLSGLLSGSWGILVALNREKTFQTLTISLLGLMIYLGLTFALGFTGPTGQQLATWLNPFQALSVVLNPFSISGESTALLGGSAFTMLGLTALVNGISLYKLRDWNPPKTVHLAAQGEQTGSSKVRDPRNVWSLPIVWREICTLAYGRKTLVIKGVYLLIGIALGWYAFGQVEAGAATMGMVTPAGMAFIVLGLMSLMIINAQGVTAITSERDGQTLEVLLVTDVSPKEFVFGKLMGVLYNTKEAIVLPLLFVIGMCVQQTITVEHLVYLTIGYLSLCAFSAMLGTHSGLTFDNSQTAIVNSLGTMFFLFIGIFICMMLIVEARSSFLMQLPSFLLFIVGGSIGLWASMTHKNPSPALTLSSAILPFCTFYAITSFLLGETLGVCLFVVGAYGFTALAMLIPAISEFDLTIGRATIEK